MSCEFLHRSPGACGGVQRLQNKKRETRRTRNANVYLVVVQMGIKPAKLTYRHAACRLPVVHVGGSVDRRTVHNQEQAALREALERGRATTRAGGTTHLFRPIHHT